MNRKLRNRHRIATTTLAFALPLVFVAGLAVRPATPVVERLPAALTDATGSGFDVAGDARAVKIGGADFYIQLLQDDRGQFAVAVDPAPGQAVIQADVLVHWTAGDPSAAALVPADAYLLGTLAGPRRRVFGLPPPAGLSRGYLSFYSLAAKASLPPVVSLEEP